MMRKLLFAPTFLKMFRLPRLTLNGVDQLDNPAALRAWQWIQWVLLAFSILVIPAFYAELTARSAVQLEVGKALYSCVFAGFAVCLGWLLHLSRKPKQLLLRNRIDLVIVLGAAASVAWGGTPWSAVEWALRMAFMCVVASRIVLSLRIFFAPNRLFALLTAGAVVLTLAGAGFYWLEPNVHTYADGLWLAFESSATVGYGDLAPTTPASRVFAAFVVLLGYGMLSLVFASIAAMFIDQEERQLRREMHRDIKRLHEEVTILHHELKGLHEAVTRGRPLADENPRNAPT